jgi:hypothetical protein
MQDQGANPPNARTAKDCTQPLVLGCSPDEHDTTLLLANGSRGGSDRRGQAAT